LVLLFEGVVVLLVWVQPAPGCWWSGRLRWWFVVACVVGLVRGQVVKTACQRRSQGRARGQWVGRCSTGWRWGRASRAGMLTRWVRRVAPRATV
jgi:hypothetical protein